MYALSSLLNQDEEFTKIPNPTLFNDKLLDSNTKSINEILCDISSDTSDIVATCPCGHLTGDYYEGTVCEICKGICRSSVNHDIKSDNWLEIPKSITKVLQPTAYGIISKWMGRNEKRQPHLDTILNIKAELSPKIAPHITDQGFNFFYDNFDFIIDFFAHKFPMLGKKTNKVSVSVAAKARAQATRIFLKWLDIYRDRIWCTKMPILSKRLQPITKVNDYVRYADASIKGLMNSIVNLNSVLLSERMMRFNPNYVERNFFPVYKEFMNYAESIAKVKLSPKPGIMRKHVFGSRMHCTGRSVVSPIVGPHDADEVYLPWKLGVSMYAYHIISILVNRCGETVLDAYNQVTRAINVYDYQIDGIMQTLIDESPRKGLPVLMQRNPSLKIAACQLLKVTKIKPALKEDPDLSIDSDDDTSMVSVMDDDDDDELIFPTDSRTINPVTTRLINDKTIEVSPLIITGPNMDFDGDEANLIPIFEDAMVDTLMALYPAHRIREVDTVNGGDITLSNQQYICLTGWCNDN